MDRHFINTFADYNGESLLGSDEELTSQYTERLKTAIQKQLTHLQAGLQDTDASDFSVYTGSTGLAFLYWYLYNVLSSRSETKLLDQALDLLDRPLRHLKGKRCTFLCGDAGPLALGAVVYHEMGRDDKSQHCLARLHEMHSKVVSDPSLPDELLYGRTGYLYSLLFIRRHLDENSSNDKIIEKVFQAVIASGQKLSSEMKSPCPLMYDWHERVYLGAAHGLVGILYTLMQLHHDDKYHQTLTDLVRPCLDHLITLKFPSGNYPSSVGSSSGDKLVHWCHGAPGWIHTFIMAYKVYHSDHYIQLARDCADVIWDRGLLRKGYGLCHGVSGNAMGFLALYQVTKDQKYIYRAWKFAEWCIDYGRHGCREADRPYSLFEGLAGSIYFLTAMLKPMDASFPAFSV